MSDTVYFIDLSPDKCISVHSRHILIRRKSDDSFIQGRPITEIESAMMDHIVRMSAELAQLTSRAAEDDALRAERDRLLECTKETEFAAKCPECDRWTDFGYLEDWGMCYACHIEKKVYTWKAVESDTDPRHIFDETGRCIRCGEDAEEHEAECVEGWTARLEDTIDALRATVAAQATVIALNKYVTPPFDLCDDDTVELALECAKKDETIAKQKQTIEAARERVTLLESVVTESCGDHPENSCESWCDQCKRGADALRKAFAANAPTPTQGETEDD